MKKIILGLLLLLSFSVTANAQFGKGKKIKVNKKQVEAAKKTTEALTLSDEEIKAYAQNYMDWMDANNPVCSTQDSNPDRRAYAERLNKILANAPEVKRAGADVKVYYVINITAFSSANGSIRLCAGMMDKLTDDEMLAIIGHELAHFVKEDSKNIFKNTLLTSALKDAVASTGKAAKTLTNSQLGSLGAALSKAQFSERQITSADDFSYEFLKGANKDPRSMARAIRALVKLNISGLEHDDKMQAIFFAHPEDNSRAERLEQKYAKENK